MTRRIAELSILLASTICVAIFGFAWRSSRIDQKRLRSVLSTQAKLIADANDREKTANSNLAAQIARIERLKKTTRAPAQAVAELPKYLPLPTPITLRWPDPRSLTAGVDPNFGTAATAPSEKLTVRENGEPLEETVVLPQNDLKPLLDFSLDYEECRVELQASAQEATEQSKKLLALSRERDAALTAAKGGSFLKRLRREALWLALGALAGSTAIRAR